MAHGTSSESALSVRRTLLSIALALIGASFGVAGAADDPPPPVPPAPPPLAPPAPPSEPLPGAPVPPPVAPPPVAPPIPAPVPPLGPNPVPVAPVDPPADPVKAELERRRRELAERKTQLVETARPAMELLEKFARRELRLWTTMRGELAELGATAIPALLIGIDDPDWEIRAFAASTIAVIPQTDTAEPLMRAIGRETFVEAKRQMVMALANARSEAARSVLETATGDKDPGVRIAAVRGVGQLGASADALRKFVSDADLDVRYEALGAMAAQGDQAAITELVRQAEKLVEDRDRARQVSGELADNGDRYGQYLLGLALARAQDPRAQRIVRAAVFGEKPWEHKDCLRMGVGRRARPSRGSAGPDAPERSSRGVTHADDTKVRLGVRPRASPWSRSPERVRRLVRALGDSQLDVRHEATVGLGRLPTPEAADALRKALSDRADEVRLATVRDARDGCGPPRRRGARSRPLATTST